MAPDTVGNTGAVIDLTELSSDDEEDRKVFSSTRPVFGSYAVSTTAAAAQGYASNSVKKPNPSASPVPFLRPYQGLSSGPSGPSFSGRRVENPPREISHELGLGLGPLGQHMSNPASVSGFVGAVNPNPKSDGLFDLGNAKAVRKPSQAPLSNQYCVQGPSPNGMSPGLASSGREGERADAMMSPAFGTDSITPSIGNWGEALPAETPIYIPEFDEQDFNTDAERGMATSVNATDNWADSAVATVTKGSESAPATRTERSSELEPQRVAESSHSPQPAKAFSDASVCRHFWKAGDYEAKRPTGVQTVQGAMDHVRVHPKFLHSNATSHKWALGAVAELLDNAVDEIANGASFVNVDKIVNPRDGCPALLIEDDGGGMSPHCMRQCMSLGYSRKNTNSTIGQYGNGFKTSTMRLGADVIVFSRCVENSITTQSIGLLSYTFLRQTGHEDVVVPMVDYDLTSKDSPPKKMVRSTEEDWDSNMKTIAQWSPYDSEALLLRQFDKMGSHGTKVIVYNLWYNDDGVLELDFDTDEHDIQLRGGVVSKGKPMQLVDMHIANRYRHSLRVYASILYLRVPPRFNITLRGSRVVHHNISADLKFPESIVYKPQIGNGREASKEISVITVIGFTKEAPLVNVHGFNVYHKNRLIIPFWKVWQDNSSRGRGVVGVLEANFVEPAHDKQDFERTAVLTRLETRLKQMTVEYWNLHCHLIGYQPNTKAGKARKLATPPLEYPSPIASILPSDVRPASVRFDHGAESSQVEGAHSGPCTPPQAGADGVVSGHIVAGRALVKSEPVVEGLDSLKRNAALDAVLESASASKKKRTAINSQPSGSTVRNVDGTLSVIQSPETVAAEFEDLEHENLLLKLKCAEYEVSVKKLESMVAASQTALAEWKAKYAKLADEASNLEARCTRLQSSQVQVPAAVNTGVNSAEKHDAIRPVKMECDRS